MIGWWRAGVAAAFATALGCSSGAGPVTSGGVGGASASSAEGSGGSGGFAEGSGGGGGGAEVDVPRFIHVNYLDVGKVESVSRFRSAVGHDFSDSFEKCRSMKHYLVPSVADWTTMEIRSPVDGTVAYVHDRMTFGAQVGIQPGEAPAYVVRLFHVQLAGDLQPGATVKAGQVLGTHASADTMSDVAVELDGAEGYRLVPYALALADDAFAELHARGVASREALVITRAERDADPLGCEQDGSFTATGSLQDWVALQ